MLKNKQSEPWSSKVKTTAHKHDYRQKQVKTFLDKFDKMIWSR